MLIPAPWDGEPPPPPPDAGFALSDSASENSPSSILMTLSLRLSANSTATFARAGFVLSMMPAQSAADTCRSFRLSSRYASMMILTSSRKALGYFPISVALTVGTFHFTKSSMTPPWISSTNRLIQRFPFWATKRSISSALNFCRMMR